MGKIIYSAVFAAMVLWGFQSFAALGEGAQPSPVSVDKSNPLFTIQTVDLQGCTVREFVKPDGSVFGAAWEKCKTHPDLKLLLGKHYDGFAAAHEKHKNAHRHRMTHKKIESKTAVVRMSGHMLSVSGTAVLKNAGDLASYVK